MKVWRYAVYLVESTGPRFNACFATFGAAVAEAGWYRQRGYRVVVCTVPDDLRKYALPPPWRWLRVYGHPAWYPRAETPHTPG